MEVSFTTILLLVTVGLLIGIFLGGYSVVRAAGLYLAHRQRRNSHQTGQDSEQSVEQVVVKSERVRRTFNPPNRNRVPSESGQQLVPLYNRGRSSE